MSKGVTQRVTKPATHRGKLALEKRAPKIHENVKKAMFMKGGNASLYTSAALKEICMLKKPHTVTYTKKNNIRPFEDSTLLELFAQKADASLFLFGCHSKKRPHNLILGRMFDFHILDMVEFGIDSFKSMHEFKGPKCAAGTKPCLQFLGDLFETDDEFKKIKNLLADFFRGERLENIRLDSVEHLLQFVALNNSILLRSYRIQYKKSGGSTPRVELEEIGPSLDLSLRRKQFASTDLFKKACRQPKEAKIKKKKNVSHDVFRRKMGRIHMTSQDFAKLQTRKVKGLKKRALETTEVAEEEKEEKEAKPKKRKMKE